jgi:hypothetical protein
MCVQVSKHSSSTVSITNVSYQSHFTTFKIATSGVGKLFITAGAALAIHIFEEGSRKNY